MKKEYIHILIAILLILTLGGYVYYNRTIISETDPTGKFEISNPAKIVQDNQQNKYIIDNSMRRVVKLNSNNHVDFFINGGKRSTRGFFNAVDVAADDEGNLYILELVYYEGTAYTERQRILKYNGSGNFVKTLYSKDFFEEEQLGEGRYANLKYINGKLLLHLPG